MRVPVGTQVLGADGTLVCDLAHPGARVVIARGGRGGAGNRALHVRDAAGAARGGGRGDGDERTLDLHLKLMADAALLGFPNVGKSSLLAGSRTRSRRSPTTRSRRSSRSSAPSTPTTATS